MRGSRAARPTAPGTGIPLGVPPMSCLTSSTALFSKTYSIGARDSSSFAAESPCIATLIGAMTNAVMIRQIHNPGRMRRPRAAK